MALIGIYGGTFNPIHFGHLRPILEVQQALSLDKVHFIPCFKAVHKDQPNVSAEQRLQMIKLALGHHPSFIANDIEIEMGGPSYTIDTLRCFKQQMPNDDLVLIMGTDSFAKFDTWKDWQEILTIVNIAVTHRPGETLVEQESFSAKLFKQNQVQQFTQSSGQTTCIEVTQLDISSTNIRQHLAQGLSIEYLVPDEVSDYIQQYGLYTN